MKITEISVNVSRTFNLGNFESLKIEAGAACSVDSPSDVDDARASLLEEAKNTLREAYIQHHPSQRKGA